MDSLEDASPQTNADWAISITDALETILYGDQEAIDRLYATYDKWNEKQAL
jgi:hypothetical protein